MPRNPPRLAVCSPPSMTARRAARPRSAGVGDRVDRVGRCSARAARGRLDRAASGPRGRDRASGCTSRDSRTCSAPRADRRARRAKTLGQVQGRAEDGRREACRVAAAQSRTPGRGWPAARSSARSEAGHDRSVPTTTGQIWAARTPRGASPACRSRSSGSPSSRVRTLTSSKRVGSTSSEPITQLHSMAG